jgi:hypothetical protein
MKKISEFVHVACMCGELLIFGTDHEVLSSCTKSYNLATVINYCIIT